MRLVYNSNSTMHLPALMQIRLARETGWDGIFVREEHLRRYLAQGFDLASLRTALGGLGPVNLGALADVERWRPDDRAAMLREATALTELAVGIGASFVQLLTGPVRPGGPYSGPGDLSAAELRDATSSAIRAVADLGAPAGIRYYLEPVAWTPLSSLRAAVEVVDATERDNVGLVLASGTCVRSHLRFKQLTQRSTDARQYRGRSPPGRHLADFRRSVFRQNSCLSR